MESALSSEAGNSIFCSRDLIWCLFNDPNWLTSSLLKFASIADSLSWFRDRKSSHTIELPSGHLACLLARLMKSLAYFSGRFLLLISTLMSSRVTTPSLFLSSSSKNCLASSSVYLKNSWTMSSLRLLGIPPFIWSLNSLKKGGITRDSLASLSFSLAAAVMACMSGHTGTLSLRLAEAGTWEAPTSAEDEPEAAAGVRSATPPKTGAPSSSLPELLPEEDAAPGVASDPLGASPAAAAAADDDDGDDDGDDEGEPASAVDPASENSDLKRCIALARWP
mmetsp:Transcript_94/g.396  ORF Transcript_94/g.396 Transcript_94/m.396 type:complete len:279 (-) Transcript_94:355-1191(-)